MSSVATERSKIAHAIRVLAVPIVLGWMALTVITNVVVPSLEKVGEAHTVSMNAQDAPAFISMQHIGANFQEFDSDSNAMIILEGDKPLGADAHHYYDGLIKKLEADTAHVEHVADFWGDPLTASGAQSNDGKSAYVQLYLHGNMGETLANESVAAVRDIVDETPAAAGGEGLRHRRRAADRPTSTTPATRASSRSRSSRSCVIAVMLLLVYRSDRHHAPDPADGVHRTRRRPRDRRVPRLLRDHRALDVRDEPADADGRSPRAPTTRSSSSAGIRRPGATARTGKPRTTPCSTAPRTSCSGSGLTIAGAMLCLSFTRLPYFQTMGVPCAVGMLVAVVAALTLGPGGRSSSAADSACSNPNARSAPAAGAGSAPRWCAGPARSSSATLALALIGLLALPGYKTELRRAPVPARRHRRPTSDTPPPTGISTPPG